MMLKKNLWVVVLMLASNCVSGFLIENVTVSNDNNSIFVNDSMNLEGIGITKGDIDLYNATSTGQISNANESNFSTVNLHLKYPYNTVVLSDNSTAFLNVVDKNITIDPDSWIRIEGVSGGVVSFVESNWEELLVMFGVACCMGVFVWYKRRD